MFGDMRRDILTLCSDYCHMKGALLNQKQPPSSPPPNQPTNQKHPQNQPNSKPIKGQLRAKEKGYFSNNVAIVIPCLKKSHCEKIHLQLNLKIAFQQLMKISLPSVIEVKM